MEPANTSAVAEPTQEVNKTQDDSATQSPDGGKKRFFSRKIIIGSVALLIFGILILIMSFIFTRNTLNNNDNQNSHLPPQEEEDLLLANVGATAINRNDVREIALEQILNSGIDGNVLRAYLNEAIERAILDQEASLSGVVIPPNDNKIEYYESLKQEIIKGELTEITAYDVSWWIPPAPDYEQRPEFDIQRQEGALAAQEIATALRSGSTPLQILPGIITKYPSLEGIIGINGGQYATATDKSVFELPRVHQYNSDNLYLPFYEALYSMQSGEVRSNIWENGSGASIIYVVDLKRGTAINYDAWLKEKSGTLVTLYQDNIDKL